MSASNDDSLGDLGSPPRLTRCDSATFRGDAGGLTSDNVWAFTARQSPLARYLSARSPRVDDHIDEIDDTPRDTVTASSLANDPDRTTAPAAAAPRTKPASLGAPPSLGMSGSKSPGFLGAPVGFLGRYQSPKPLSGDGKVPRDFLMRSPTNAGAGRAAIGNSAAPSAGMASRQLPVALNFAAMSEKNNPKYGQLRSSSTDIMSRFADGSSPFSAIDSNSQPLGPDQDDDPDTPHLSAGTGLGMGMGMNMGMGMGMGIGLGAGSLSSRPGSSSGLGLDTTGMGSLFASLDSSSTGGDALFAPHQAAGSASARNLTRDARRRGGGDGDGGVGTATIATAEAAQMQRRSSFNAFDSLSPSEPQHGSARSLSMPVPASLPMSLAGASPRARTKRSRSASSPSVTHKSSDRKKVMRTSGGVRSSTSSPRRPRSKSTGRQRTRSRSNSSGRGPGGGTLGGHGVGRVPLPVLTEEQLERLASMEVKKGKWSPEEDKALARLVDKYGDHEAWKHICLELGGRNTKQCRERWNNHLDPTLRHGDWSPEEDEVIETMRKQGAGWAEIAKKLQGRTDNKVKIRYHSIVRRKAREQQQQQQQPQNDGSPFAQKKK